MKFGTVIITKDRNWCLEKTVSALLHSELAQNPIVVVNNGSTKEDPAKALGKLHCEYVVLPENIGIVGARFYAHRVAEEHEWTHYCFLQDDFELKLKRPRWLADTLEFIERYTIDYCRLTTREGALGDGEHWVKGVLRVKSKERRWNCSHIQMPKNEELGQTQFILTDKHYSDWAHIMSVSASRLLFDIATSSFTGPTVTDRILVGDWAGAFSGAIKSEFDTAVRHWIAYSMGLISCTGVVNERPCWCGVFEHQTTASTSDYRDLPANLESLLSIGPR